MWTGILFHQAVSPQHLLLAVLMQAALVLQTTNAGVRRPGSWAMAQLIATEVRVAWDKEFPTHFSLHSDH